MIAHAEGARENVGIFDEIKNILFELNEIHSPAASIGTKNFNHLGRKIQPYEPQNKLFSPIGNISESPPPPLPTTPICGSAVTIGSNVM